VTALRIIGFYVSGYSTLLFCLDFDLSPFDCATCGIGPCCLLDRAGVWSFCIRTELLHLVFESK